MRLYKGFQIIRQKNKFMVIACGANVIPGCRVFESEREAEIYTDLFIAAGGTPFGRRCNIEDFERRVQLIDIR